MSLIVEGLHHVTSICADPVAYDRFWRGVPGLARVKKTVNFDNPSLYHLYYGVNGGVPGTIMTYFGARLSHTGARGAGEVAVTQFRTGRGSLGPLAEALRANGATGIAAGDWFGRAALRFAAPDGDLFDVVEARGEGDADAVTGLNGVILRVADPAPTIGLLERMGYAVVDAHGPVTLLKTGGNGANEVAVEAAPDAPRAGGGVGSVHHVAFAVADEAALEAARGVLLAEGVDVTEVRDRNYFRSIYFREPGGVLFEFATNAPGFAVDEPVETLGQALKLPPMHEGKRAKIEAELPALA